MKLIKKEIVLAAPVAKVWEHITDSKKIAGWLMPNNFEPEIGREFSMTCNEQGQITCVVKEIIPEQKVVYSFRSPVTKVETLVTLTLSKEGKNTRLTLVHSGWEGLPPDQQNVPGLFDDGWGGVLKALQLQLSPTSAK
jgi:uncharacterized protein YndB with AHSA1/START domain